jgi:Zn-dependent peptidase ImmA (M78 family)
LFRSELSAELEREANMLAVEILLPERQLNKYISENPKATLPEMAELFRVSTHTMSIRLGVPYV